MATIFDSLLSSWNELNTLTNAGLDPAADHDWDQFVTTFTMSFRALLEVDRVLIMECMERQQDGRSDQFPRFFETYDLVCSRAIDRVQDALTDLPFNTGVGNASSNLVAGRDGFLAEFQESMISEELDFIGSEVLPSEVIDAEAKFDIAKEATDSVKAFVKRALGFVPGIRSILSTVNELLSIGRRIGA